MNILASYRYQMEDNKKGVGVYYLVIACVFAFFFIMTLLLDTLGDPVSGQLGGFDFATIIFLFVASLNSFKENFGMLLQNGISRKTLFYGRLLTSVSIAFVMAIIDKLLLLAFKALSSSTDGNLVCSSLFEQAYQFNNDQLSTHFISFLLSLLLYMTISSIGYFITILYYRLGKSGKIAISVALPVGLFMVFPLLDYILTRGRISARISILIDTAFGLSTNRPGNAMITCLLLFILLSLISWLMIKRAAIKE